MAEPLKEMFNLKFYRRLAEEFSRVDKGFSVEQFVKDVTVDLERLSLNERMRRCSVVLRKHLPENYEQAIKIMVDVIPQLDRGYTTLLFPDFVGQYGTLHFEASMEALKYFTKFGSSEFAIRVFLKKDFEKTLGVMYSWAEDKDLHVRRLASEGSRPRLPWSFKLDEIIRNPKHTIPILERLKSDPELYVRKSVANHLNDVSKEHPDTVLELLNQWKGQSRNTDWVIKHGARTLLKKGNQSILDIFGVSQSEHLILKDFTLKQEHVNMGKELSFSFIIENQNPNPVNARVEFGMYFRKKDASLSKKVFKIGEKLFSGQESRSWLKTYSFKPITTRVYHSGIHEISIIVNGKESERRQFTLLP